VIEFVRWQFRLLALRVREHARSRRFTVDQQHYNAFVEMKRLNRFLDRVSPFSPSDGYQRVFIRRAMSRLAQPRRSLRRTWWRAAERLMNRVAPYTGPGKFEGFSNPADAIKAEWLYRHSEYAEDTTGDSVRSQWSAIFTSLDVPWSRQPEHWIIGEDAFGFVTASRYEIEDDAQHDFAQEQLAYERVTAVEDLEDAWRMPSV
jgi:hypothetical protein